jgi:membrane fusion protein, multidrug efflux system
MRPVQEKQANTRLSVSPPRSLPHGTALAWLGLLAGALAVSCRAESKPLEAEPERPRAVREAMVREVTLREQAQYVGTVRSAREVQILARTAGTLIALPYREGEAVATGDVVARLDDAEATSRRRQARSELRRVRSDRDYVCDSAATDQALAERGSLSTAQADRSRAACSGAQAAVEAAEARVDELGALLQRTEEEAPFDGRLLRWVAEPGENVAPGRPLAVLGGTELEIAVDVTEGDLRRGVEVGTRVVLATPSGLVVESAVVKVAPMLTRPGRTADVRVAVPEPLGQRLRHGESVTVAFVLAEAPDAAAVPERALVRRGSESGVFVIDAQERARWTTLAPGVTEAGWTATEPALEVGARVAVSNLDVLRDGEAVYAVAAPE